jgi:phosphate transport system protein
MSRKLDDSLHHVLDHVVRMGSLAHNMVELAVQSVFSETQALYDEVTKLEAELDKGERDGNQMVLELAVLQSPVAQDLLFLTSTLVILGEIERTGDDAYKLARRSSKLTVPFPEDLKELLVETDRRARANFLQAISLISSYDSAKASELIKMDQGVDNAYKASRRALLEKMVEEPDDKRQFFRVSEMFHALEHVSDHAVNIAKTLQLFYDRTGSQPQSNSAQSS